MNVAACLMGKKGLEALVGLLGDGEYKNSNIKITVVVGQDDAVKNDYSEEIIKTCQESGLTFLERRSGFDFSSYSYVIAIGWRWIIHNVMPDRLVVFHDSLLPKYRGFAPLVNAAMNREPYVGVTALFGAEEYDRGDIIKQEKIGVEYPISIEELIDEISNLYASLLKFVISSIVKGELTGEKQNETQASYSVWLDNDDYRIDWSKSSEEICHKITLLGFPYENATAIIDDEIVYIEEAFVIDGFNFEVVHPGKVIFIKDGCPVVICGDGAIKLTKLRAQSNNSLIPFERLRKRFR
jgi:methionyl-tRNA formyltransferase